MNTDISLDLYLHKHKIHRGHISFLGYFMEGGTLPKHKFTNDLVAQGILFDDEVTPKGHQIYAECQQWIDVYKPQYKPPAVKHEYSKIFMEYYNAFPDSDNLMDTSNNIYRDDLKEYLGFRNMKIASEKTKAESLYLKYVKEFGHETMLKCLRYDIAARLDQTKIRKENQITSMSNAYNWLYKRKFEAYFSLVKRGEYQVKGTNTSQVKNSF